MVRVFIAWGVPKMCGRSGNRVTSGLILCRQMLSDRIEKNIEDVLNEVVPPRAQTAPPRASVRAFCLALLNSVCRKPRLVSQWSCDSVNSIFPAVCFLHRQHLVLATFATFATFAHKARCPR